MEDNLGHIVSVLNIDARARALTVRCEDGVQRRVEHSSLRDPGLQGERASDVAANPDPSHPVVHEVT